MTKELWLNLPVKDINKSKEFFIKLGFAFDEKHGNSDDMACLIVGSKNVAVMLFTETMFKGFTRHELTDTTQASEILISFDAESRNEVDELAKKRRMRAAQFFVNPKKFKVGCMVAVLPIWTVIAGMCYLWI